MQTVILAGGLATRMRPITEKIPKALILVHERPFVDYQLKWLAEQGITEVVFCIGYKGNMIREYLGEGHLGMKLSYVDEGSDLKGTAGALKLAESEGHLKERFFVLYGDSFLPINFSNVWTSALKKDSLALMTILKNEGQWEKGNVETLPDGKIFYDKFRGPNQTPMPYVDYGLSVLKKEVVTEMIDPILPGTKSDLANLFMSEKKLLDGFEVHQRFYEIGSREGLSDFESYLERQITQDNLK
jgi:MurNAc alpha-1-phosphate uridylyltransferase